MIKPVLSFVRVTLIAGLMTACSMGGGETGTGLKDQTTQGVITGFGSVYVNGIRYATDNATVLFDETEASESQLKVGMLVTLTAKVETDNTLGYANTIIFEKDVEGEVLANNYLADGTLDVLGQTVYLDNDTIFESQVTGITDPGLVTIGNYVEVSGYSDGTGQIFATRFEVKAQTRDTETVEVKGVVQNLNGLQFSLGSLAVDASNAQFKNMTATELANGQLVKVESEAGVQNGVLPASRIVLKKATLTQKLPDTIAENEEIHLEGVVTALENDTVVYINGQKVLLDTMTKLEDLELTNLTTGTRVKLEGFINQDGDIVASELKGLKISSTKLEGNISAIDSVSRAIIVNGVTVRITASTRVKDDAAESDEQEKRYFNFSDLNVGDKVSVSFYYDANSGTNLATKMEREKKETGGRSEGGDSSSDDSDAGNDDTGQAGETGGTGDEDSNDSNMPGDNDSGTSGDQSGQDELVTKGIVSQLDESQSILVVEGLSINYSRLTEMPTLTAGMEVEVKSVFDNGVWYATELDVEDSE